MASFYFWFVLSVSVNVMLVSFVSFTDVQSVFVFSHCARTKIISIVFAWSKV